MSQELLLLNGPNLNMLGGREESIYGSFTLQDIERIVSETAKQHEHTVHAFQSNHEGHLIDQLQKADKKYKGIIFNPGAFSHTSIALHDAIRAINTPVIEVHISNIFKREEFRHKSLTAPACKGQIIGLGLIGYKLATLAFIHDET